MVQQRQWLMNSKSQNEFFNPQREPMSGFLVYPNKQSEDVKEMANYFSGPLSQRPSHSGSLVPGSGWDSVRKEAGEQRPRVSNKLNLSKSSTVSGLVPRRTSMYGDQKENPVPLRPRQIIQAQKPLESTNGSESRRRFDKKGQSQIIDLSQRENGKVSIETLIQVSFFNYYSFLLNLLCLMVYKLSAFVSEKLC